MESVTYGSFLYKLFIASILGTRLLRGIMIFFDSNCSMLANSEADSATRLATDTSSALVSTGVRFARHG